MSPALLRKGMTKILQNCAFVSYASTFLHLQPRLTQFFAFFLQTRRLSMTSFSLQHFLLTINFLCKSLLIQHFKKACKNYVFKTWMIALMGFYSSPSKISAFSISQKSAGKYLSY
jgi:hypothetical protein